MMNHGQYTIVYVSILDTSMHSPVPGIPLAILPGLIFKQLFAKNPTTKKQLAFATVRRR
jgi:hypothetical protein